MFSALTSPTVHAVGSVTTSTIFAAAVTSHYGDTGLSLMLVLVGAGIPSSVAIWLANRAQKNATSTALAFATEAAERVETARKVTTDAATAAAAAVLDVAQQKAHEMMEAARIQAAQVIATAVPVATAMVDAAIPVASAVVEKAVPVAAEVVQTAKDVAQSVKPVTAPDAIKVVEAPVTVVAPEVTP